MKTLIDQITTLENEIRENSIARYQRIENAFKEANRDLEPTVDRLGRFHAPCDGYMLPASLLKCEYEKGDYEDQVFGGGEYLPIPLTPEDCYWGGRMTNPTYPEFKYKDRVKVSGDFIAILESIRSPLLGIGFGKTWEQGGVKTCYAYLESNHKKLFTFVKDYAKELFNKKEAEIKAAKGTAPTGKTVVTGTVIGLPVYDGYYGMEYKMMVELENGSTVYGSLPKKLWDVEKGQKVTFSANFEHSKDDTTHSFYKRPTKPAIL